MGLSPEDEEKLKVSFSKIKEEIHDLKAEISQNKGVLENIKKEIESLRNSQKIGRIPEEMSSKGSRGVVEPTLNQRVTNVEPTFNSQNSPNYANISNIFDGLTKQEFKTFLATYQLNEEKGRAVAYSEIALKLGLKKESIRWYVASLSKKQAPILKNMLNDGRCAILIDPIFKSMNTYQKLLDFYYRKTAEIDKADSLSKPSLSSKRT